MQCNSKSRVNNQPHSLRLLLRCASINRRRFRLKKSRIVLRILPVTHRLGPSLALLATTTKRNSFREHIAKQRPPSLDLWRLILILKRDDRPALALAPRARGWRLGAVKLLVIELVAPLPLDTAVGSDGVDEMDRLAEPVETAKGGAAGNEEEGLGVEGLARFLEVGVGVLWKYRSAMMTLESFGW